MHEKVVLVVDPNDEDREETIEIIRAGLPEVQILTADSLATAIERLEESYVDAVVTRYELTDGTGLELTAWVREHSSDTGCLLYATRSQIDTEDFEDTVVEYIPRDAPSTDEQLVAVLEAAIEDVAQAAYPLPDNEEARLEAVATYTTDVETVDTALNRVTKLAADHFGVEVASINIIRDHDQQFLTCHGAEWPPTSRDDSICTYTILEDRVMVVEDTQEDPRFADNESVQSAGIRAYLGANLISPNGYNIGSLCVYDDEPRAFSSADEEYLTTLAALVMDVLALGGDR